MTIGFNEALTIDENKRLAHAIEIPESECILARELGTVGIKGRPRHQSNPQNIIPRVEKERKMANEAKVKKGRKGSVRVLPNHRASERALC